MQAARIEYATPTPRPGQGSTAAARAAGIAAGSKRSSSSMTRRRTRINVRQTRRWHIAELRASSAERIGNTRDKVPIAGRAHFACSVVLAVRLRCHRKLKKKPQTPSRQQRRHTVVSQPLTRATRKDGGELRAFSNPRMILKWVGTGEDTGWVVISFLAGSGRGISRGREAQPGRSRIASCATSFLSVRFALRAESGRREPGGRTQARLGGASRPRRGRVSPARAARGQQFPLALLHP